MLEWCDKLFKISFTNTYVFLKGGKTYGQS